MKNPNLESMFTLWQIAPPQRRAAALAALRDGPRNENTGPRIVRWTTAAKELSISVRALRYAVEAAGIEPVRLPGRSRAIGIRERDLAALAEGGR